MEIYTFANMYEYFFILMYICLIKRSNLNFYYRGENPNKDVKTLASGIYQIDGGNEAYTPTRWGMLIVFSAPNYGYALFTHTDGSVYVRTWSQRNGSYYIDWKKLSN